jgi:hypothetical protein
MPPRTATPRATTAKEWALAIGGGLLLATGLVAVLRGGDAGAPPLPAPAPQPAVTASPPTATTTQPGTTSAAPGTSGSALALTGLRAGPDGGMAIISRGGRQYRLVPGRSLPGGPRLVRVEPGRAILAGPTGEIALGFPDGAPAAAPFGPPGGDPTPWRLALQPVREGGTLAGWRLTGLDRLPQLARAGLRPGDVLVTANGMPLISEEKIIELPQELAANGGLQLGVRRDGRRLEITVER